MDTNRYYYVREFIACQSAGFFCVPTIKGGTHMKLIRYLYALYIGLTILTIIAIAKLLLRLASWLAR